jgi:translation initiation factor 4E
MTDGTALHAPYTFSFMRRGKAAPKQGEEDPAAAGTATTDAADAKEPNNPYETSIKSIITVGTVEEFWATYNFLKRPNDLPSTTDYHFFRGGIKPTWEDAQNAKGGKWIVRFPKGLASRYWEEIILALIGGQFTGVPDGEICGAVLSVRYSEDILGVWNKSATDRDAVDKIRDAIKKILQLPSYANMEYKPHQTSMQDRSSFRNTQVWKPKSLEGRSSGAPPPGTGDTANTTTSSRRTGSWGERNSSDRKPSNTSRTSGGAGEAARGAWR